MPLDDPFVCKRCYGHATYHGRRGGETICRCASCGAENRMTCEAWNFSWTIHIRCLDDGREGLKHKRCCAFRTELDLTTLVTTRGRDFPLAKLSERLRCPRCGCRRVAVMLVRPQWR